MICTLAEYLAAVGKAATASDAERALALRAGRYAERAVKKFLKAGVEQATYVEVLPDGAIDRALDDDPDWYEEVGGQVVGGYYGNGNDRLGLGETPVRSVTSVFETAVEGGGGWPPGAELSAAAYYLDAREPGLSLTGQLVKLGAWSRVPRSVRVTYVAGYTAAELAVDGRWPEFKQAVQLTAAKVYRTLEAMHDHDLGLSPVGPAVSESVNGSSVSVDAASAARLGGQLMTLTPEVQELLWEHRNLNRLGVG